MKTRVLLGSLVAAVVLALAGYALYASGLRRGMSIAAIPAAADAPAPAVAALEPVPQGVAAGEEATRRHIETGIKAGDVDPVTGKAVLYYHDPMVPGNKFDKPAKSPFMDMMLVPVYADNEGADAGKITVSPRIQQNLGLRTAEVVEAMLAPQVAAVGSVVWNERDQAVVQARATGFVEKLHVRATLDRVAAGQALAEIYVPDWIAAQEEFLSVRRMQGGDLAPLVDGARQRMRQAGMSDAQIALVESSGRTQPRITLAAPIGGIVTELMVREGTTVMAGATLFRINGTRTVWAQAEVPESQAALLRPGARVRALSPAVPGRTFEGRVQALLPEVDPTTRTLKARLELANPGGRLVPGMFVQMQFTDMRAAKSLVVPTEAVIQTGTRTLQAGQRVVVSSQFLIDSEASLKGVEARLNNEVPPPATERHTGEAKVESVGRDTITLSHGPIPSLKWGPMTMDFKRAKAGLPRGLAAGDQVGFEFFMDAEGLPQLTRMTLVAPSPESAAAKASGSKP